MRIRYTLAAVMIIVVILLSGCCEKCCTGNTKFCDCGQRITVPLPPPRIYNEDDYK